MIDQLRLLGLLNRLNPTIYGNDLPEQGGITGNMPRSSGPYNPNGPVGSDDIQTIASMSPDTQQMPSNEAEQQLRAMLGQMPVRNKPGIGRHIMGALAGLGGGNAVGEAVRYAPYLRQMAEFEAKLKPLKELADVEQARDSNRRLTESSERTAKLNREKLDLAEKTAEDRRIAAEKDREIKLQRQRLERDRYENPNNVRGVTDGGKVYTLDPHTNKMEYLIDSEGNQVMGDKLTPEQNMTLSREKDAAALARIKESGNQTRQTQTARYGLMEKLQELRQKGSIELKQTPSGNFTASAGKGLQPSQQRIDRINSVMQILSEFPELEPYYSMDDDGNIKVVEGDDPALRQIAVNKLFDARKADVPLSSPMKVNGLPGSTSGLKKAADIPAKDRVEGVTKAILGDGSVGVWGGNGWVKQ